MRPVQEQDGFLASLDRYWFGRGSPTSLGLFRIFIATLAFIDLCLMAGDWWAWFSETGFVPDWIGAMFLPHQVPLVGDATVPRVDILAGVTNPMIGMAIYGAVMVVALLTALGLWTRVTSILLAIGIVSLHHRNAAILHGGDTVLRVSVLYLAISPCGRACSMDRLIRLWRGRESTNPVSVSLWPQRLVTYNVALIYFTTVWIKYFGHLWLNGTATWYPARLNEFHRFPVPDFMNQMPMVTLTTYGTLAIEFGLATAVFFRPLRTYCLVAGVLLHAFIEYSMNIPLFSYLMVSMYICFYDGEEVSAWAERMGRRMKRAQATILLPAGMRLRPAGAAFLDAVDAFKLLTYLPGTQPNWAADPEAPPMLAAGARSIGAWPFAWVPGVWRRLMNRSLEPHVEPEPAPKPERHRGRARSSS